MVRLGEVPSVVLRACQVVQRERRSGRAWCGDRIITARERTDHFHLRRDCRRADLRRGCKQRLCRLRTNVFLLVDMVTNIRTSGVEWRFWSVFSQVHCRGTSIFDTQVVGSHTVDVQLHVSSACRIASLVLGGQGGRGTCGNVVSTCVFCMHRMRRVSFFFFFLHIQESFDCSYPPKTACLLACWLIGSCLAGRAHTPRTDTRSRHCLGSWNPLVLDLGPLTPSMPLCRSIKVPTEN